MPTITIRQLHDDLKQRLRLRAARNGRSREDGVRNILRRAAEPGAGEGRAAATSTRPPPARRPPAEVSESVAGTGSVEGSASGCMTLVIDGGISADESLDVRRRLRESGLSLRCIVMQAALPFIPPLAAAELSVERVLTGLSDPAV